MLWFEYYKRPSGGSPLAAECQGRWLVFYLPTFEIKLLVYWLFYSIAGACACRCSVCVKARFDLCSLCALYMITPMLLYYFTLWRPPLLPCPLKDSRCCLCGNLDKCCVNTRQFLSRCRGPPWPLSPLSQENYTQASPVQFNSLKIP